MNDLILTLLVVLGLLTAVFFLSKRLADTNTLLSALTKDAMRHALSINTDSREFMLSDTNRDKEMDRLRSQLAEMRARLDMPDLDKPEQITFQG